KSFVPFEGDIAELVVRPLGDIQIEIRLLNFVFNINLRIAVPPIKESKIVSGVIGQRQSQTSSLNAGKGVGDRGAELPVSELGISKKVDARRGAGRRGVAIDRFGFDSLWRAFP